tara:strand:- start:1167 stop:1490 length:324 start_codon:yes stop_codon:yes gene_type:complete
MSKVILFVFTALLMCSPVLDASSADKDELNNYDGLASNAYQVRLVTDIAKNKIARQVCEKISDADSQAFIRKVLQEGFSNHRMKLVTDIAKNKDQEIFMAEFLRKVL